MIDRSPAVANWTRLFDETLARLTVKIGREELSLPEALNRMSDPDAASRKQTAQALAKALEARTPTLALALNTIAFEKQVEDTYLHELGHHLGLDEQELRKRGLG